MGFEPRAPLLCLCPRALDHCITQNNQFWKLSESCFDTVIVSGMFENLSLYIFHVKIRRKIDSTADMQFIGPTP